MQSNNTIYGFSLGNTGRVLYNLKNIDCCYIIYPNNINHYLDMLIHDQPPYILGLGPYSGVNQNQIKIETQFSNKFRNEYVKGNTSYKKLHTRSFLSPSSQIKPIKASDNSYCNLVSWKIAQLINRQLPHSHYTFLHVPKTMRSETVSQIIDKALAEFSKSSIPIPGR